MVNSTDAAAKRKKQFEGYAQKLHFAEGEEWLRGALELAYVNGKKELVGALLEKVYMQIEDVKSPISRGYRYKPALAAARNGSLGDFCRQLEICEDTMRGWIGRKLKTHPEFVNFTNSATGFRQVHSICRLIDRAELEAKNRFREILRTARKADASGAVAGKGVKSRKDGRMT